MLEQTRDPLRIFLVSFLPLDGLDELRVADYHMTGLLQNVVDWEPVLLGGFHTHIQTVVFVEPIGKTVQICVKCGEPFLLITRLQAVLRRLDDSRHQEGLVNIHPTACWKYDFQSIPSS